MTDWETVIGVEVHLQLRTRTKMFCATPARYGARPNTHVCPVCAGLPGALPVPNREAVELGVRAALALGCEVHGRSGWARKNYFYPDLPKGFQITQFAHPLATGGEIRVRADGGERLVRIRRMHLEEDAGKSFHDRFPDSTAVDLNRAGVPLLEIVSEPDLRSPAEARTYLVRLRQVMEHFAAVSDCNMEQGSLRIDANLSVRRTGDEALGTKTEIKNLNSFVHVEKALTCEQVRQIGILEAGGEIEHETRLYDESTGRTRAMRGKEEALDYRYFPEPDLPPLVLEEGLVEAQESLLPELPDILEARLAAQYTLGSTDVAYLAATPRRAAFFEEAAGDSNPAVWKIVANLMMGEIAAELNRRPERRQEGELLAPPSLRRIAELRHEEVLSAPTATRALELLIGGEEGDVDEIVERHALAQVSDADSLARWIERVFAANPAEAGRLRTGEDKLIGFFMGEIMRMSGGKADPGRTKALLVDLARGDDGE